MSIGINAAVTKDTRQDTGKNTRTALHTGALNRSAQNRGAFLAANACQHAGAFLISGTNPTAHLLTGRFSAPVNRALVTGTICLASLASALLTTTFCAPSAWAYPSPVMIPDSAPAQHVAIAPASAATFATPEFSEPVTMTTAISVGAAGVLTQPVQDPGPLVIPPSFTATLGTTSGTAAALTASFLEGPAHNTLAPDPLEKFNRFTFSLNDRADKLIFVPLSKGYRAITTNRMRKALRNFLDNLNTPVVLINDILQGKPKRAAETAGRFVINSAIGFGGVADPAKQLGIAKHSEDFGQTLAVWGVPSGPYVVLPFFGPSTIRDGIGLGIDGFFFSPLNYIRTGAAQKARLSRTGASLVAFREPLIEPLAEIEANSLDYYSSFRSFYLQARRREILDGQTVPADLPDLDEFDDFDDFDTETETDTEEGQLTQ